MIEKKEHLIIDNLTKIIAIKYSINKGGLPDKLKEAYPDVTPAYKPLITNSKIPNPHWISGFVSAEGCFMVDTYTSGTKVGYAVNLNFYITQHIRDTELMENIAKYLNCGSFKSSSILNEDWGNYKVKRFSDINEKIIPFFKKKNIL